MTMHDDRTNDDGLGGMDDMGGEPWMSDLAVRLDQLGDAERRAAPDAMEERLMALLRRGAQKPATAEAPTLRYVAGVNPAEHRAGPAQHHTSDVRWARLPLAAAVALAATLGAVWLSQHGEQPSTSRTELAALTLEQDVRQWLTLSDVIGQDLNEELAALDAEASRLARDADEGSTGLESWIEEGSL